MFHSTKPLLIAHRGFSATAPENTLAAVEEAIRFGADIIEIDVHLSKDGIPVVIHDETLERTTDAEEPHHISTLSLEELKQFDAGTWFHPDFSDLEIPTLSEVLTIVQPHPIGLMIEIKTGTAPPEVIASAVLQQLVMHNLHNPTIIGSFDPEIIKAIQNEKADQMVIGIASDLASLSLWNNVNVSHFALSHHIFDTQLVKSLHHQNKKIWSFTVDDPQTAHKLLGMGIRGIITNDPSKIKPCFSTYAQY